MNQRTYNDLRTIIPWVRGSIRYPASQGVFLLAQLILACVAFLPNTQAVTPAPDGGYAGDSTAEGTNALFSLTSGLYNTAVGFTSLYSDTTGGRNTAMGVNALRSNTTGGSNTALGVNALFHNTSASYNTAIGDSALFSNATSGTQTAVGYNALFSNTSGQQNNALGWEALKSNTAGNGNTAVGWEALHQNTTGFANAAFGNAALAANNGLRNTGVGSGALFLNGTGSDNIALGYQAGVHLTTGSNNIHIGGNGGVAGEASTIRIGNPVAFTDDASVLHPAHIATYVGGIYGRSSGGIAVYVNSDGKLGTVASSQRFKDEIKPMDKASEAILGLKPVTFRYKKEIDPDRIPQFGLVAEQVEKVDPDLVARDKNGKPYTVRYEAVNAMVLNEFLKEHRQVLEQQKEIDALRAELREQRALIRKVSARVELQTAPAQTVANSK